MCLFLFLIRSGWGGGELLVLEIGAVGCCGLDDFGCCCCCWPIGTLVGAMV